MNDITVTHVMANGEECKDLSIYMKSHDLPPGVVRILREMLLRASEK